MSECADRAASEPGLRAEDRHRQVALEISSDPLTRLAQAESFWRRNPGWVQNAGMPEATGTFLGRAFRLDVRKWFGSTEFGCGQLLLDQMRWQIRTQRQPDNEWWMRMNERLVGDALVAEAALRAGCPEHLTTPNLQAWANYIRKSDEITSRLGIPVGTSYRGPGTVDADTHLGVLDEIWRTVGWRDRLRIGFVLGPAAWHAYWVAHDESIKNAAAESEKLLRELADVMPEETAFSADWARHVQLYRYLNPPAVGRYSIPVNRLLLPQHHPVDPSAMTRPQKLLAAILRLGHRYLPRRENGIGRRQRSLQRIASIAQAWRRP